MDKSKQQYSVSAALHGTDEPVSAPLTDAESRTITYIRRFGTTGTVMMAIGAIGAGAQPVLQNPAEGILLGLPARLPSVSLTLATTGILMFVSSWLLLARFVLSDTHLATARHLSRKQLDRCLLVWIMPLTVAPPMFSKDIYSYLAQSEISALDIDPYLIGPLDALGADHVLTRSVPNIWRHTPAPYGPLFLWIGEGISRITGHNIIVGVLMHRGLALLGIAMIIWALPRLARRCHVSDVVALWLGAANPLLLFHLIAGIHNEAVMIGMMLVGLEWCMRVIEDQLPMTGKQLGYFLAGIVIIALSSMIKIPSLLALGFIGMALAHRWGGNILAILKAALLMLGLSVLVISIVSIASGLGFGWTTTLNTASVVRSWLSLPTLIGLLTGFMGVLLGLGDHTSAILEITRPIALTIATVLTLRMLLATLTNRIHAVGALGLAMFAIVLLFPAVQLWYLLWAIIPLAAWATSRVFRLPVILLSAVLSIMLLPNGGEYPPLLIVQSAVTSVITLFLLLILTRNVLPWIPHHGPPIPDKDAVVNEERVYS